MTLHGFPLYHKLHNLLLFLVKEFSGFKVEQINLTLMVRLSVMVLLELPVLKVLKVLKVSKVLLVLKVLKV